MPWASTATRATIQARWVCTATLAKIQARWDTIETAKTLVLWATLADANRRPHAGTAQVRPGLGEYEGLGYLRVGRCTPFTGICGRSDSILDTI